MRFRYLGDKVRCSGKLILAKVREASHNLVRNP